MSGQRRYAFGTESILRLRAGEEAPHGKEIVRMLGQYRVPVGTGTASEEVYVVVVRAPAAAPAGETQT